MRETINQFSNFSVAIMGDVMLDSYWTGRTDRISPEAPVPILNLQESHSRPGGAANVALNIKSLGAKPILFSVIGQDSAGKKLSDLLQDADISTHFLLPSDRKSTEKIRVLNKAQQLLRIDNETTKDIDSVLTQQLLEAFKKEHQNIDVLILQDYNKGVLTTELIAEVMQFCAEKNIPVVVDPKEKNFFSYKNASLFKPNWRELNEAFDLYDEAYSADKVKSLSVKLQEKLNPVNTLITLSSDGMFFATQMQKGFLPAQKINVADVSGAGDSVISVAALALIAKASIEEIASLSNLAGGIVCQLPGVVPISKAQLLEAI